MTAREKLVKLLVEACRFNCGEEYCQRSKERCMGKYADHLQKNGVVLLEEVEGKHILCLNGKGDKNGGM